MKHHERFVWQQIRSLINIGHSALVADLNLTKLTYYQNILCRSSFFYRSTFQDFTTSGKSSSSKTCFFIH